MPEDRMPEDRMVEELLATAPFDRLDPDGRLDLAYEARLSLGLEQIPSDMPQRAAYVRFQTFGPGDVIVHQGELSTEFVVVCQGEVGASYVRDDIEPVLHRAYGRGTGFGEASALSHQPSLVTCAVEGFVDVVALDHRLFVKLFTENDDFRALIDQQYREDHLALHLGCSPLLRGLDMRDLAKLAQRAELRRLKVGEVLATQGAPADEFHLVRSGAVKCVTRRDDGPAVVRAFYRGNSSFGEHSIVTRDAAWPGTCEAMMDSDVVVLPRAVFESVSSEAQRIATLAANRILVGEDFGDNLDPLVGGCPAGAAGEGAGRATGEDEVHVMVAGQSVKGGEALVIDQTKCIRCNMCVESCVAVHKDGIPRISKVGTKITTDEVLITACYHCEVPECMLACDFGAIRRDAQGRVRFEFDNCVGCADCISACPYGVIRLVEPFELPQRRATWLDRIPFLGRLLGVPAAAPRGSASAPAASAEPDAKRRVTNVGGETPAVAGKTIKCDLCADLPFEACVYNCPTSAIHRRAPESLFLSGSEGR